MSRSPGRFTHRSLSASGSCSGERGNVLGVGNCCYVAVCSAANRRFGAHRGTRGAGHTVAAAILQLVRCKWRSRLFADNYRIERTRCFWTIIRYKFTLTFTHSFSFLQTDWTEVISDENKTDMHKEKEVTSSLRTCPTLWYSYTLFYRQRFVIDKYLA